MTILLITTKKLPSHQLVELGKHYSVLNVDKQHLNKGLHQLGNSEVIILNLNLGLLHRPSNSAELKWISSQDTSDMKVVYIYSKLKYQKLYAKANVYLKSLPLIVGKTLDDVISLSQRIGNGSLSISLTRDDLNVITEEIHKENKITAHDIIELMERHIKLVHDFNDLLAKYNDLSGVIQGKHEEPRKTIPKEEPQKPTRTIRHIPKGIELIENGKVCEILNYSSRQEQRVAKRDASKWLHRS